MQSVHFPPGDGKSGVPDPWATKLVVPTPVESTPQMEWKTPIPGLTGELAYFIYSHAHKQNPEVAIAAALAMMAGITGRAYNWNRTGLNQYFVLLGISGQGKEDAEKGIRKLLYSLIQRGSPSQQIDSIVGPSHIASAPGLINQLRDTPCFLAMIGEFGKQLEKLCSKFAKSNEIGINSLLLDLYNRSGQGDVLGTSAYSDKAKNGALIQAPCFSILGNSTQHAFYKAINEDNVTEGLVSRLTVIECAEAGYIPSNHNPLPNPPEGLLEKLSQLIMMTRRDAFTVTTVDTTPNVMSRYVAIDEKYGRLAYDNRDKPYMLAYNRVALITMKTASLLAIGVNPYKPCITDVELDWAERFANNSAQTIIRRFETGKVGETSPHIMQHEQLLNCLNKYLLKPWTPGLETNYGITSDHKAKRVVTYRYIHNMLHKQPAFRNAPNPKMAFENMIEQFTKSEYLIKIHLAQKEMRGKSLAEMWFINDIRE